MSIHVRASAKGPRYQVKQRSADGSQHSRTFKTKREAVDYEARQLAPLHDGAFISPKVGATSIAEVAERWMASGNKRETTQTRNRSIVVNHIVPGLGERRKVSSVTRADCQSLLDSWAKDLAPRTVARQYATLRALFQYALDADLIARNPAARLRVPTAETVERPDLTGDQLDRLAEELGPNQAAFMWCAAILGLRWSETAGLTVGSIDVLKRTVHVTRQIDRHGSLVLPKTRGSVRKLAAPGWLIEELAALIGRRGLAGADVAELLFVNDAGNPLSYTNWRTRVWQPSTVKAGLAGLRYHDLRSTAATALVASGVDLRTAMHRLGHTTPTMTLAVYARVAEDKDRAAAEAASSRLVPSRSRAQ